MREIKFRAWILDKYDSYNGNSYIAKWKMVNVHSLHIGTNKIMFTGGSTNTPRSINIGDECIVEQFTGLRDKNGREIYEGDIVYAEHPDEGYLNAQIVYDDIGSFVLKCNSLSVLIPVPRVEIIGNIHENPELLA